MRESLLDSVEHVLREAVPDQKGKFIISSLFLEVLIEAIASLRAKNAIIPDKKLDDLQHRLSQARADNPEMNTLFQEAATALLSLRHSRDCLARDYTNLYREFNGEGPAQLDINFNG